MNEASNVVELVRIGGILVATPVIVPPGGSITWKGPPDERLILIFPEPWILEGSPDRVDLVGQVTRSVSTSAPKGTYPYAIYRKNWRDPKAGAEFQVDEHSAFALGGSHPRILIA